MVDEFATGIIIVIMIINVFLELVLQWWECELCAIFVFCVITVIAEMR